MMSWKNTKKKASPMMRVKSMNKKPIKCLIRQGHKTDHKTDHETDHKTSHKTNEE